MMKKKITIIIGMILLAAGASYVAYAAGVFNGNSNGLILDMDLSKDNYTATTKTFSDKSGSGHNGVSANTVTFNIDNNNKNSGAMVFGNGTSDSVNVGSLGTVTNWTIGILFYSGSVANYKNLFHTHFPTSGSSNQGVRVEQYTNGNLYLGVSADNNWRSNTITSGLLPNTWYQLVIVGDSGANKLYAYLNGVKKLDVANTSWPTDFPRFSIGRGFSDLPLERYFNGSIANVKVYNRALSSTDVQTLYSSSKPQASVSSIQNGLVGYWPLDSESYNASISRVGDKTPYENHGINYGTTLTTDRMGQNNGATSFFTSTGRIYISAPVPIISHNLSMSAWIYPTQYPSERATIILGGGAYYLSLNSDGSLQTYWYGRNPAGYHSSGAGTIPLNAWSQVAATWSDSSVNLYVNGVLKNTVAVASGVGSSTNAVYFGAESTARQFNGAISEIRIYNRTISADEVSSIYGAYKPKIVSGTLQKGLVLDMPLTSSGVKNSTVGSEIMTDKTPYSNDGQNYGATVASDSTSFNGSSNYISIPNSTSLNPTSQISLSAWIKPVNITTNRYYEIMRQESGSNRKLFSFQEYGTQLTLGLNTGGSYWETDFPITASYFTDGKWHHVMYVYDGAAAKLYVDGVLNNSRTASGNIAVAAAVPFIIGSNSGSEVFNGSMSGVKVYNRALSNTEVKSLYDRGR